MRQIGQWIRNYGWQVAGTVSVLYFWDDIPVKIFVCFIGVMIWHLPVMVAAELARTQAIASDTLMAASRRPPG